MGCMPLIRRTCLRGRLRMCYLRLAGAESRSLLLGVRKQQPRGGAPGDCLLGRRGHAHSHQCARRIFRLGCLEQRPTGRVRTLHVPRPRSSLSMLMTAAVCHHCAHAQPAQSAQRWCLCGEWTFWPKRRVAALLIRGGGLIVQFFLLVFFFFFEKHD